jgi:superfamily I DNA/RNA helicase
LTDFVVEKVLEHNESGLGLRRQAILVRTAYWSDHLEVELTRRNIPYRKYGGLKFLEAAHIKDLMSFLAGARESARSACLDTHPASSRRDRPGRCQARLRSRC